MRPMFLILLALALALAACGNGSPPADFAAIRVEARPVPFDASDATRRGAGRLKFMGGVELRANEDWFGGLSGLRCPARCHAVGDTGTAISFDLVETDGRLTGIANVMGGALLDTAGQKGEKATRDAESLILDPGRAEALVGFERTNSFAVYPLDPKRWQAKREYRVPEMAGWPENGGAEALVLLPNARFLVIAEEAAADGVPALILGGRTGEDGKPANLAFTYVPPRAFSPTDAVMLDDARVLVLNRAFSMLGGVAMALVEVDVAEMTHAARVTGREIARLRPPVSIDNMEGIELRRVGERTFIYLLSDNNFNAAQRTLLLKFELLPEAP